MKIDGEPSTKTWLPESFVERGGTIEFVLSATQDKTGAVAQKMHLHSFSRRMSVSDLERQPEVDRKFVAREEAGE